MEKSPYGDSNLNPLYYSLIRDIHSLKGTAGMILSKEINQSIHNIEHHIISQFDKEELRNDLYDRLIGFFSELQFFIRGDRREEELELVNIFVDHHNEKKAHKEVDNDQLVFVPVTKVYVIGKNKNVLSRLSENNIEFSLIPSINDFYHQQTSIGFAKLFFINIDEIDMNPFHLHEIINNLNSNIQLVYLANGTQKFCQYLSEHNQHGLSFHFLSTEDKNFDFELSKLMKLVD